jgi:hypothetical protein
LGAGWKHIRESDWFRSRWWVSIPCLLQDLGSPPNQGNLSLSSSSQSWLIQTIRPLPPVVRFVSSLSSAHKFDKVWFSLCKICVREFFFILYNTQTLCIICVRERRALSGSALWWVL